MFRTITDILAASIAIFIAILSNTVNAAVIITDINQVLTVDATGSNEFEVDVNNDGLFDVAFLIGTFESDGQTVEFASATGISTELDEYSTQLTFGSFDFETVGRLSAGDVVDAETFDTFIDFASFYSTNREDNFLNASGDTGFLGFRLSMQPFVIDTNPEFFYGFIEVTRGSITIGNMGFQTTAGAGLTVANQTTPDAIVSAPATLGMMLITCVGFMSMRRRQG